MSDTDPTDIAFTYAGYAPLSIRLVEHALRSGSSEGGSKETGLEEALKSIPGPAFDIVQTVDEHGLPVEQHAGSSQITGQWLESLRISTHPTAYVAFQLLSLSF